MLSEARSLETVETLLELEVVVGGSMSMRPQGEQLTLREGDRALITCTVEGAFPRPSLAWLVSGPLYGSLDTSGPLVVEKARRSHLLTVSQTVTYTGRTGDNNRNITCRATQQQKTGVSFKQEKNITIKIQRWVNLYELKSNELFC